MKAEHHHQKSTYPFRKDKNKKMNNKQYISFNDFVNDFNILYKALKKSRKHRRYTNSSLLFYSNAVNNLLELQEELLTQNYKVSGYIEFTVSKPKERSIKACKFRDKIVQHILCDNILCQQLSRICIKDNYAGQKNKGTLYGRERLRKKMQAFYFSNELNGYIFKGDISKYYYNISHEESKDIMKYYYPEDTHWLIDEFIDSTDGDIGIALGNQINTVVSNLYLDGFDKFVTGELGIRYYGRYADDFYMIHESKEYLKYCEQCIEEFLDTLHLTLNPKSQIMPFKNGISFLGFHFYPRHWGVEIRLDNTKKRNYRRKFNKMIKLVQQGKITYDDFLKSYISWKEHVSYCTDHHILDYYENKIKEVQQSYDN